jgi:hypothetical protein
MMTRRTGVSCLVLAIAHVGVGVRLPLGIHANGFHSIVEITYLDRGIRISLFEGIISKFLHFYQSRLGHNGYHSR